MHELNHKDMFIGTNIYIRHVVIYILLVSIMLVIELFYPTQLHSFIGFYFGKLPLFIPYMFTVFI